MTILTHLTAEDRLFIAEALLLRRYVGHDLKSSGGGPSCQSEAQAHIALKLAKRLGVFDEYWRVMQATDVLSIAVKNLDQPPARRGRPRRAQADPAKNG